MEKINFVNNQPPALSDANLNKIQTNVEDVFNGRAPMGAIFVEDVRCVNMFNRNEATSGFYVSKDNGIINMDLYTYMSERIYVGNVRNIIGNDAVSTIDNGGAFYTAEGIFISGFTGAQLVAGLIVPVTAYYVIVNCPKSGIYNFQLQSGTVSTPYSSYRNYGFGGDGSVGTIIVDGIYSKNFINNRCPDVVNATWDGYYLTTTETNNKIGWIFTYTEFEPSKGVIQLVRGSMYTFSYRTSDTTNLRVYVYLMYNGEITKTLIDGSRDFINTFAISPDEAAVGEIGIFFETSNPVTDLEINKIQLERGNRYTSYGEYQTYGNLIYMSYNTEYPTNKYIDGKRVYTYIFDSTSPSVLNEDLQLQAVPTGFTELYDIKGMFKFGSYKVPALGVNGVVFVNDGYVQMSVANDAYKEKPITITLEYFKN